MLIILHKNNIIWKLRPSYFLNIGHFNTKIGYFGDKPRLPQLPVFLTKRNRSHSLSYDFCILKCYESLELLLRHPTNCIFHAFSFLTYNYGGRNYGGRFQVKLSLRKIINIYYLILTIALLLALKTTTKTVIFAPNCFKSNRAVIILPVIRFLIKTLSFDV